MHGCWSTLMLPLDKLQLSMRTKDFPAFYKTFSVFGVDDEHNGMAVVVISVPDISDTTLSPQVPEFQDGGWEGDLAHYTEGRLVFLWRTGEHALFCPTVGPILSGVNPGVSLYSVLIFSSNVCQSASELARASGVTWARD